MYGSALFVQRVVLGVGDTAVTQTSPPVKFSLVRKRGAKQLLIMINATKGVVLSTVRAAGASVQYTARVRNVS